MGIFKVQLQKSVEEFQYKILMETQQELPVIFFVKSPRKISGGIPADIAEESQPKFPKESQE